MKPVATIGSMHVCPMCTGTVPHVGGPAVGPGQPNVLMNGKPVLVMGDLCTCMGPPDTIVTGNPHIKVNGFPIACVGDMTAHGGSIVVGEPNITCGTATPLPPATMRIKEIPFPKINIVNRAVAAISGNATKLKEAERNQATIKEAAIAQETEEEKQKEDAIDVTMTSDYAMVQAREFAKQFTHASFYMFMSRFFGEEVPIVAYKKLYDALSNGEYINPGISVKKYYGDNASFYKEVEQQSDGSYEVTCVEMRIGESIIRAATQGETDEIKTAALAKIFTRFLEEYGHYLDYLLRYVYSFVAGDPDWDEGAEMAHLMIKELKKNQKNEQREKKKEMKLTYSQAKVKKAKNYFLTTYNPFEDSKLEFGKANVDGKEYTLALDLNGIQTTFSDEKERIKADIKTVNEEYFASGLGNPKFEHYGHLGIEKVLEDKGIVDDKRLSHIYLGNYMRDMSQVITTLFTHLKDDEKAKLDKVDKELYGFEWMDSIKPSREALSKVVELLAANQMYSIVRGEDATSAIGGVGREIMDPAALSDSQVKDTVEKTTLNLGLKGIQVALNYRLFIKHYGGFSPEELGVYRPEEHIDSPLYAVVYDKFTDDIFYGLPEEKPAIGSFYGMKRHIRNEENCIEKDSETLGKGTGKYAGGKMPTAVSYMESQLTAFYNAYENAGGDEMAQNRAFRLLGNALHVLEDFFAHTNFVELSLIKLGISVYPWVDIQDPYLTNYPPANESFEVEQFKKKNYKEQKERVFKDKEEIGRSYYEFKALDEFAVKGFYFSSRSGDPLVERIYIAKEQSDGTYLVKPALNGRLVRAGTEYIKQLPLVSGYFSSLDSAHSLIHVLEKGIKIKEITFKAIVMDNDGITGSNWEGFALDLTDMIVLHILVDLKHSQKEKNKSGAETGVDYSTLLELYTTFIEYRQILISAVAALKRGNAVNIILIDIVGRLINGAQAAVTNMVKKILIETFELLAKGTLAYQNMEVDRPIGTDPSHSQVAKDHTEHPLHSLAANQARVAVAGVGLVLKEYLDQKRKLYIEKIFPEKPVKAKEFIEAAKKYMVHPAQSHWMDTITEKWVAGHGKKISELNEDERFRKDMHAFGKMANETADKILAEYNQLLDNIDKLEATIDYYVRQFKQQLVELRSKGNDLKQDIVEEFFEIINVLEEGYDTLKRNLNYNLYQLKDGGTEQYELLKQDAANQLEQYRNKAKETINKVQELIKESGERSMESIEEVQDRLNKYYESLFTERQKVSPLEAKVYAYAKDHVPEDAKLIESFYHQQKAQYAGLRNYMKTPPDTMLASLNQQKRNEKSDNSTETGKA